MGSIVLDGSTAYAMRTSRLLTAYAFSYFAWGKLDPSANMTSGNYCAFSQGVSSSIDNVFAFGLEDLGSDSDLDAASWARSNVWNRAQSTATIVANSWLAFGGTWSGVTSRAAYVNGGDKGTDATSTTVNMGIQNRFGIGGRFRSSISGYWHGKLARMAFWSVALSDAEHLSLAGGADPTTIQSGNLLAYYPGEVINISGTDYLEDTSGNGNHLQLFGTWSYDAADNPPSGLTQVEMDSALEWNVLGSVEKDSTLQWSILKAVAKDSDLRWSILQALYRDLELRWDSDGSTGTVVSDLTLQWNIVAAVTKDLLAQWSILSSLSKDSEFRWSVLSAVAKDLSLNWAVLQAVFSDKTVQWSIVGTGQKDLTLRWSIQSETSFPDLTGTIVVEFESPSFSITLNENNFTIEG